MTKHAKRMRRSNVDYQALAEQIKQQPEVLEELSPLERQAIIMACADQQMPLVEVGTQLSKATKNILALLVNARKKVEKALRGELLYVVQDRWHDRGERIRGDPRVLNYLPESSYQMMLMVTGMGDNRRPMRPAAIATRLKMTAGKDPGKAVSKKLHSASKILERVWRGEVMRKYRELSPKMLAALAAPALGKNSGAEAHISLRQWWTATLEVDLSRYTDPQQVNGKSIAALTPPVRTFPIVSPETSIGRISGDIIVEDPGVSDTQARLIFDPASGRLRIEQLGTVGGINLVCPDDTGLPVQLGIPLEIRDGDRLEMGSGTRFTFTQIILEEVHMA